MVRRLFIIISIWQSVTTSCITVVGQQKKIQTVRDDVGIISQRLAEDYLRERVDEIRIKETMESLRADGSWAGTDYTSVSNDFPAGEHLKKLRLLAIAYAKSGSAFYRNDRLKQKILLAYDYYLGKKPKSRNWWFNEIGAPQDYLVGLLLMKAEIPERDLRYYSSYVNDLTDNPAHRGMNRVWVSAITITKGCVENNEKLVDKGFRSVASTLIIAEEQGIEGIKIDNSFHQHRPQLYSGGYGMGFAESIASIMALSSNTSFNKAFSVENKKIFSDMLLYGHQLLSYKDAVDFGTIGRNISRPGAIRSIDPVVLEKMAINDRSRSNDFTAWKGHLEGADFPPSFQGNRYFWKSDIMTYHGPDYYLSAKVISTRTNGTEMLNGENLKGYNLPLGTTNILRTGQEYKDIFPIWDWTRVPGSTAVMNQSAAVLPWYLFGSNEFAGGISDGKVGAIAYQHSYNGVQAKKAYFFADGKMLCLGAAINAIRTQQVATSVNQCYLVGETTYGSEADLTGVKLNDSLKTITGNKLQWIYHDGVGYSFPNGGNITLKTAVQTGSWNSINASGSKELISRPVFSLWLNHGTSPRDDSYYYIVSPEHSLEGFREKALHQKFMVIHNDKNVQAVKCGEKYFVVMYKQGRVDLGNGLKLSCDGPVILMLEEKDNGYQFLLSDPIQQQEGSNITINKLLNGPDAVQENGSTTIAFKFPKGGGLGNSAGNYYKSK
ncbi:polysaccharide lyase family 8 super-sandwich domain-containing protein [Pedobacter sp.]